MVRTHLNGVLAHLRQAAGVSDAGAPADAELLERFVAQRDHAAFELLVWRHGAMVLQACRRLLARPEDAEDAFQATFLALVRRAKSIKRGQVVAGWLHTVACRVALRVRSAAARRLEREQHAIAGKNGHERTLLDNHFDPIAWAEVRTLIDEELSRLSAKLRDPFVLCCLEGLTNEEAARQLGCPKGTVLSRLSRARERLRVRLLRRGVGIPAAGLVAALSQEAAAALAPAPLVVSTVKAATLLAAGQATTSVVSAPVAALTEGVIRAMFLTKLKMVVATVVVVGGVVAGSGGLIYHSTATAQIVQQQPAAKAPVASDVETIRRAEIQTDEAKVRLAVAEAQVKSFEARFRDLQTGLDAAKAELAAARAHFEAAVQDPKRPGIGVQPPAEPQPKKPAPQPQNPLAKQPPQNQPAAANQAATLPGGASLDLVHLATVFVDAIRDLEMTKVQVKNTEQLAANKVISAEEATITRIKHEAAKRKVDLLRAIAEGSLRGAENELQIAHRQHESGIASLDRVNAAETKISVLKLILGSAK